MRADRIADAVEDRLRQQHAGHPTLFRRELGVCVGAGRIDVAAVNGSITACEVKSSSDGLGRLPQQVQVYGRVADIAILAVERVHPLRIMQHLPDWWGIWHVVEDGPLGVVLDVLREPQPNPDVQPLAVAQLLWRAEALDALKARRLHKGLASATRWRLWEALAAQLSLDELREEVRMRLRARQEW